MSWVKYKLTLLFFITIIAVGVSVILSEFNPMVYPVGPVRAFNLIDGESGFNQLEFLGEKIRVELPGSVTTNPFAGERVENSKRYLAGAINDLNQNGGQVLEECLYGLKDWGGKMASGVNSRVSSIIKDLRLKEWFPIDGAQDR